MTYLPIQMPFLFLQGGAVAKRLRGVNSRFEAGDAGLDSNVAIYAVSICASILAVILIRRVVLARRWSKIAGVEGFGLDKESLGKWWPYLSRELRQNPNRLFDSRERIATEMERLVENDESTLARLVHECWLRISPEARHPLTGLENLVQTETVLIRNEKGRLVMEGFLRRVGQDAVDVVPFVRTTIQEVGLGDKNVDLDRSGGCESIFARTLKTTADGRLWTFSIGVAAKVEYQRLEFRINTTLACLFFDKRLTALAEVKSQSECKDKPTHHLLAKQQRENKVTIANLMKRKKLIFSSRLCHLVDLSALGARLCIADPDHTLREGQSIFLFMPFEIRGMDEEHLVKAEIVETWTKPTPDPRNQDLVVRLRFFDLEDAELQLLRRLVNVLNATPLDATASKAEELHGEFVKDKVR